MKWHTGSPWPRPHCFRWDPAAPPPKGHNPQFSAHICCGPMARWIKVPLGMEVDLDPSDIVLDGDPAPPSPKSGQSPLTIFRPMSIVAKLLDGSRWHLAWRWALVQATGQSPPQFLAHVYCDQTARWIKTPLGTEVGLGPGHFVLDGFPAIGERGTGPYLSWPRSPISTTAELLFILRPLQVDRGRITQFKCYFQIRRMMR